MVVDLPTPGEPVMPTRMALPVCGNSACTSSRAAAWWSAPAALDQRDRARQRRAMAGAETIGQFVDFGRLGGGASGHADGYIG